MTLVRQRVLFVTMLLLGMLSPLIVLLPLLAFPDAFAGSFSGVSGVILVLLALSIPLIFLYLAAQAAVRGGIPGVVVLGCWWLLSVLAAFTNPGPGQPADAIIKAMTLGVISPSSIGFWSMPSLALALGSSRGFALEFPIYLLFLMSAFTGINHRQAKAAMAAERSDLYSAWDETGERVCSRNVDGE